MKKTSEKMVLGLIAAGLVGSAASTASAQNGSYVINISGATLLENFQKNPASANDYFDVDGDGDASGVNGVRDNLNRFILPPVPGTNQNTQQWWCIQYRLVGSIRGVQEHVDFADVFVTDGGLGQIRYDVASKAFHNGTQYISGQAPTGPANTGNPGAAPVRSDTTTLQATYQPPNTASDGGIRIDLSIVDVPTSWAVKAGTGTPAFSDEPGDDGYGRNPAVTRNKDGSIFGFSNQLADLGPRNLNVGNPDSDTIFDTPIALAPIAVVTNLGTGVQQWKMSTVRYMNVTGRTDTGENFNWVCRDSGSGTRNAFCNTTCTDPSWGKGENVGPLSSGDGNLSGALFIPGNKNGNADVEATLQNNRLAVGYAGAERGKTGGGWLTGGRLELVSVQPDIYPGGGSAQFSRPTADDCLNNDVNGWVIAGPAVYGSLGDRLAAPVSKGGTANGNPAMLNVEAAAFLNNVFASIAAFTAVPGGASTEFTPAELAATLFILTAASDNIADATTPCNLIVNPQFNQNLQDYVANPANGNALTDPAYATFGTKTLKGIAPTRKSGVTYSDGVVGGGNYRDEDGDAVAYGASGSSFSDRNRIAGDFSGNGVRDNTGDVEHMMRAYRDRYEGAPWTPPAGSGPIAGSSGGDIIIEVIGDFNGDGNFDATDVRYWGDGLHIDTAVAGNLNRKAGFIAIDTQYDIVNGATNDNNFFNVSLVTGAAHTLGAARADIAGATGTTPGYHPIGSDSVVDSDDICYVYAQFKRNADVTDGVMNWNNLLEAQNSDLSADIDGDLDVDQDDVTEILTILGTTYGDVNLDGDVTFDDCDIIFFNWGMTGACWSDGDLDGDGTVGRGDLALYSADLGCNLNWNADCAVDAFDYDDYVSAYFTYVNSGGTIGFPDYNCDTYVDAFDYDDFASDYFNFIAGQPFNCFSCN